MTGKGKIKSGFIREWSRCHRPEAHDKTYIQADSFERKKRTKLFFFQDRLKKNNE